MRLSRRHLQFSTGTVFVVMTAGCVILAAIPRIQAAREASRRAQCHDDVSCVTFYGLHHATCPPCRREMVRRVLDETVPSEHRTAWIGLLAKIANEDRGAAAALRKASMSACPEVRGAASDSLRLLEGRR